MPRYNRTDLRLTPDGDLVLTDTGDLALVDQMEYQRQQVINRLKSIQVDWIYDHIGADLEDLLGMENRPETAELFKAKVKEALTMDGFLTEADIYMEVVPTNRQTLVLFLFVNSPFAEEPLGFEVGLDLAAGATVTPI